VPWIVTRKQLQMKELEVFGMVGVQMSHVTQSSMLLSLLLMINSNKSVSKTGAGLMEKPPKFSALLLLAASQQSLVHPSM
jgi:hypothetical protein